MIDDDSDNDYYARDSMGAVQEAALQPANLRPDRNSFVSFCFDVLIEKRFTAEFCGKEVFVIEGR